MRSVLKTLLVLSLAGLLAGPALAQRGQGRGGRGGFGGPDALALNPSVQKELNLSEDQIQKIKDVTQSIRDKHKDESDAVRNLQGDERREKNQELRKKISDETNQALAGILKPEQSKRLKEITLQQRSAQAFNDPEVQKGLNLTDDQKDKIKTINEDAAKDMRELFPQGGRQGAGGGGGGVVDPAVFKERMTKMAAIRKETMDKVTSVLTEDQKKTWKEMTGQPFEVKYEAPQGGRRGPGRAQEKDK
jgi:Spy/CpxP family protein refolding chaperone